MEVKQREEGGLSPHFGNGPCSGRVACQLRLRTQAAPQRGKLRLPVFKGRGGMAVGVNPLGNKALLAVLGDDA
jgi:hypothetical protein